MKTSPETYRLFLQISAHLTGFSEIELESTGMLKTYCDKVTSEKDYVNVESFFSKAKSILAIKSDDKVIEAIQTDLIPDSKYYGLARRIILLWYTGIWTSDGVSNMVDRHAFVDGLIWKAAETHPAGAKQAGYGSWSEPPLYPESYTK